MKGRKSGYVARQPSTPAGARLQRSGRLEPVVAHLVAARAHVAGGGTLADAVCDGTVTGWYARLAFGVALYPGNLADWDAAAGRTQAERLALVDRLLGELGAKRKRGGGWSVRR